ncbi:MAG: 16S rRNA (uracil(1498)-N(3))-methyltransferase [Ferruginibacter sp.]
MLPYFYKNDIDVSASEVVLNEDTSKHVVQVLRMKIGEQLQLTDGKGNLFTAAIADDNRKRCEVNLLSTVSSQPSTKKITIAISLIKNNSRLEWFLEKATEIGVSSITPLICERTEKQNFRYDRMKAVLISAMLQSQQTWLPELSEQIAFNRLITSSTDQQKFIAHCENEERKVQLTAMRPFSNATILIGPEGDFTKAEIEMAIKNNFTAVALGNTRLRTETAGVVAAALLCN